jgi:NDP-sugar pyrophosphorylase family protein
VQAVILAAGKGTRLRPFTDTIPKPLIDMCGKPLLEHVFESVPNGVTELIVVIGYLREQIVARFGDAWNGVPIRWVVQEPLDGTAGALCVCEPFLKNGFLVLNGDDLYEKTDLEELTQSPLAILTQDTEKSLYASAIIDRGGYFRGLASGQIEERSVRVCGAYMLDRRFFDYPLAEIKIREQVEFGLPQTLAAMAFDHDIEAVSAHSWIPVGTPEELETARRACEA